MSARVSCVTGFLYLCCFDLLASVDLSRPETAKIGNAAQISLELLFWARHTPCLVQWVVRFFSLFLFFASYIPSSKNCNLDLDERYSGRLHYDRK